MFVKNCNLTYQTTFQQNTMLSCLDIILSCEVCLVKLIKALFHSGQSAALGHLG